MNKDFLTEKLGEYRVLLIGVVATIVLIGIYFFRTGPGSDLDIHYSDLNSEVNLLSANQLNGVNISENLDKIQKYTELMGDRFISQNLADIQEVFYSLERESGVSLESLQRPEMLSEPIKPKANDVEYQPLSMAVTISGSFKNVLKFILSLENSPLLYRYNALKVSNEAQSTEADKISLTLNLELLTLNGQ